MVEIRDKSIDEELLVHMLGYLDENKFVDAIKTHGFAKDEVLKITKIMDEEWMMNLTNEVKERLKEMR